MISVRKRSRFTRTLGSAWASVFGHDVFISYARKESRGFARKLEQDLVRRGFTVFRDYSGLAGGDSYRVMLRNAAARCRLHVLILGDAALVSPWVKKEIRARQAYRRLKRLKRGECPFFPVFAKDLDWSPAPAVVRGTREFHGFPVVASGREPASWNAAAIAKAVESAFDGKRSRVRWRLTGGLLLSLLVLLASISLWQRLSSGWRSRSLEFQSAAESAETGLRFPVAELAWARAAEADFRRKGELLPRYQAARGKRWLTPVLEVPIPNAGLRWLGCLDGQPVLAVQGRGESHIRLWMPNGWTAEIPTGEDSSHRFLEAEQGLVVLCGDRIWLVPWGDATATVSYRHGLTMGVWMSGHDTPDIRLKDGKVHLLGLADDEPWLLELDPVAWQSARRIRMEPMAGSGAMRIAESGQWAAVGAQVVPLAKVPFPVVDLLAWKATGERVNLRMAARLPEMLRSDSVRVTELLPSRDDQQLFLRVEELLPGLPGAGIRPEERWVAVDVDPRRDAVFAGGGAGSLLPLHAWDDSEAVLDDGDGEVSLLTWKGPPLLERPARSVMSGVKSWALLDAGKGMRVPASLALFQGGRIRLTEGLEEILEIEPEGFDAASQSIRLRTSADGSLLAAESYPDNRPEASRIIIYRAGPPEGLAAIPRVADLERELKAPTVRIAGIE